MEARRFKMSRPVQDENVAPKSSSIHHRHKSMVALHSDFKAPLQPLPNTNSNAKRTALGPRALNATIVHTSKDDLAIISRPSRSNGLSVGGFKDFKPTTDKSGLRPFTVSALKNFLTGGNSKANGESSRPSSSENVNNARHTLHRTQTDPLYVVAAEEVNGEQVKTLNDVDDAAIVSDPIVPSQHLDAPLAPFIPSSVLQDPQETWLDSVTQSLKECEQDFSVDAVSIPLPADDVQPLGTRKEPIIIYEDSPSTGAESAVEPLTVVRPDSYQPTVYRTENDSSGLQDISEVDEPLSDIKNRPDNIDDDVIESTRQRANNPSPPESVVDLTEHNIVDRHNWFPVELPDGVLGPIYNVHALADLSDACRAMQGKEKTQDDVEEDFDITLVAEYSDEIFNYMRQLETDMTPNPLYMDNQHELQWGQRSVLIDWLVQVHTRFAMVPETLFLTVNLIDRFLSVKVVSEGKLQLVGAAAIYLAAKYEEINCPTINEMVYMVDNGYSADEIIKAERFMLTMLRYELGWPGPMSFLRRISKADDYHLETRTLAKYFMELTIMDERFIACPPSSIAAAAHFLARRMLGQGGWTVPHVYYSGYTEEQIMPIVEEILECCFEAKLHHGAIYDKYKSTRFHQSSTFVEAELANGFEYNGISLAVARDDPSYMVLSPSELYAQYRDQMDPWVFPSNETNGASTQA